MYYLYLSKKEKARYCWVQRSVLPVELWNSFKRHRSFSACMTSFLEIFFLQLLYRQLFLFVTSLPIAVGCYCQAYFSNLGGFSYWLDRRAPSCYFLLLDSQLESIRFGFKRSRFDMQIEIFPVTFLCFASICPCWLVYHVFGVNVSYSVTVHSSFMVLNVTMLFLILSAILNF